MSHADHLRQIAQLARSISSGLKLETVLSEVTAAVKALRADVVCAIRLIDHGSGGYRLAGTGGMPAGGRLEVVPFGEGLTHVVAETRKPLLVPDNRTDPRAVKHHWSATPGLTLYYGVPIEAGADLLGVLNMNFAPTAPPTEDEQASIDVLAGQAAVAIRNARLFAESEARRRAAESLAEVSRSLARTLDVDVIVQQIADTVLPLLGVESSILRRLEPDGSLVAIAVGGRAREHFERGHVVAPGVGVVGRAVAERRPVTREVADEAAIVLTDDIRRRMEAAGMGVILAVPLCVQDDTLGVLAVGDEARRQFSADDVALLQAFAGHATVALQNARLYQDVRDARDFLQVIAENSADGIVTADTHGRITSFSRGAEEILGYRAEDALGRRVADHYRGGLDEARAIMQRLRADGRIKEYETSVRRRDGYWITSSASMSLLRDAGGRVVGTLAIFRDITERKRAGEALRQSEEQVRQLQKLEAMGRLAGGVAHDFNNLLTVIRGRGELLLQRLPPDNSLRRDIDLINKAADRAASLTRQLLAFSRKQILEPKVLGLNAIVSGIATMLERLIGENVDLAFRPGPGLGRLKADPGQLEQVIVNLVVNARDAMPGGGRIILATDNVEFDEPSAREHPDVQPGSYVMLGVSDTGVGMDPTTRARIFEPFFTTKGPGRGTGLGLSTVYGIVMQSGGAIWVSSEPGQGTTFKVYFPRVQDSEAAPVERVSSSAGRGAETILLVEDEEEVRALAREILEGYGYTVLEARQPAEAVVMAGRHADPIHLILTDMVMPQMSGQELAERLSPLRPEMKVLYMSGYTDHPSVHHVRLDTGTPFIQKPFSPDGLAEKVRAVLDAPDGR